MAISDIISLLEIVRNVANNKVELDKQKFDCFVVPIWETFSEVHEDYKKSMGEYIALISDDNVRISTLIDKIKKDSLFSDDLRAELKSLVQNADSINLGRKGDNFLLNFTKNIISYLTLCSYNEAITEPVRNDWSYTNIIRMSETQLIRAPLVVYLLRKGEETNREQTHEFFMAVLRQLQRGYSRTFDSYQILKATARHNRLFK